MARLTVLDGATTIGGTKLLFETGGTHLLFDFGLSYATMGTYFEEFLQPRTSAGLTDYLATGLLPRLNVYRSDLTALLQQMQPSLARELVDAPRINACFITHGHVDHTGSISFLDETIPLYATPVAAALLRAVEETQAGPGPEDSITDFLIRPNLGSSTHGKRLLQDLAASVTFPDCRVTPFPVDHSIPGACAYLVEWDDGRLVYTGDLRFHGRMGDCTRSSMQALAAAHPDYLVIEGTNLKSDTTAREHESAFRRSFTFWAEQDVEEQALEEVQHASGLVLADFGMKDLDRLMTFQRVAHATGRRLAILPRDAALVLRAQEAGYPTIDLEDPDLVLYIKRGGSGTYAKSDFRKDWIRSMLLRFSGSDPNALDAADRRDAVEDLLDDSCPRIVRAADVAPHQSEYLLSLGYWDIQELCDLQPAPGSLYVHSSAEAFNEEMSWSQERLARWLSLYQMDSVHIHASGHAPQEDLFRVVEQLSPKRVFPIHTEHGELYAERFGDLVTRPANGETVNLVH